MKLCEVFRLDDDFLTPPHTDQLVDSSCYIGVELELESVGYQNTDFGLWKVIEDGSLRDGGKEFVMGHGIDNNPIRGEDILKALKLFDIYAENRSKMYTPITISSRCSTHIHLDVRDMEHDAFKSLVRYYAMYEDGLIKAFAPERYNNHYCRRISEIPNAIQALVDVGDYKHINYFIDKGSKYNALNWSRISNRGSLEFRFFKGTTNMTEVLTWINMLQALKKAAMDGVFLEDIYTDINDVFEMYEQTKDLYLPITQNTFLLTEIHHYIPRRDNDDDVILYKNFNIGE